MVQNRVPHCCIVNVTTTVLLWLDDVLNQRLTARGLKQIERKQAWEGFIKTEDSGVKSWAAPVWNVTDAWIIPEGDSMPLGAQDAGWLPSKSFAKAWLSFERTREHPTTVR
jgi:hypothetical protein